MKNIILLFAFCAFLFAKNPNIYAVLGDVIYDNAVKIEKLKTVSEYVESLDMLNKYLEDVNKTKEMGFKVQSGDKSVNTKEYLNKLRELSKTNDFFVRQVYKTYKTALETEDSWLLTQMINSGLMDTDKYKDEIVKYYMTHSDVMDTEGVIQKYLDEDEKLRKQQEALREKSALSKEEMQRARIKRLRENDKLKQEAVQKSLEQEVSKEKTKIRENQLKELSK